MIRWLFRLGRYIRARHLRPGDWVEIDGYPARVMTTEPHFPGLVLVTYEPFDEIRFRRRLFDRHEKIRRAG